MKKIILAISGIMGSTLMFCTNYPNYLKSKFEKNEKIQLKTLVFCLIYLSAFYIYLGYKNDNIYLTKLYYSCSVGFFCFMILFLGMLIHRIDPNAKFPLLQFQSEIIDDEIILISKPSSFLNKKIAVKIPVSEKIDNESVINYKNRPEIKSGPGNIGILYFAIKYRIIQEFYLEERVETSKYIDQAKFIKIIGKKEDINPGSFKTQYQRIKIEDLSFLEKYYKEIIILLYNNNEFHEYELANDYAKNIKN